MGRFTEGWVVFARRRKGQSSRDRRKKQKPKQACVQRQHVDGSSRYPSRCVMPRRPKKYVAFGRLLRSTLFFFGPVGMGPQPFMFLSDLNGRHGTVSFVTKHHVTAVGWLLLSSSRRYVPWDGDLDSVATQRRILTQIRVRDENESQRLNVPIERTQPTTCFRTLHLLEFSKYWKESTPGTPASPMP